MASYTAGPSNMMAYGQGPTSQSADYMSLSRAISTLCSVATISILSLALLELSISFILAILPVISIVLPFISVVVLVWLGF